MLILLSPSKLQNFDGEGSWRDTLALRAPHFVKDADEVMHCLAKLSLAKLKALLGVSDALARGAHEAVQAFDYKCEQPKQDSQHKASIWAFTGHAYERLAANTLTKDQIGYLDAHLRILSGVFGLLRPLDALQPYRLDMGKRLTTSRGTSLYDFWGDRLAKHLVAELTQQKREPKVIFNLASDEYWKAVKPWASVLKDVTVIHFKFLTGGRSAAIWSKQGRGLVTRWMAVNGATTLDEVRGFDAEGYALSKAQSTDTLLVFLRSSAPDKKKKKACASRSKPKAGPKGGASKQRQQKKAVAVKPEKAGSKRRSQHDVTPNQANGAPPRRSQRHRKVSTG